MKRFRQALTLLATSTLGWWVTAQVASAQVRTDFGFILGDASPIEVIITIINWVMGILALIGLGIILWGGFTWMLSQGEEEKISKAKAILRNGLIGVTIILASWGIAIFILNLFLGLTGAGDRTFKQPHEPFEPPYGSPFYVDHSNPQDGDTDVALCHIVAVTFSYPVRQDTINDTNFQVTIPVDAVTNPTGGLGSGQICSADKACLSGVCSDQGRCQGDTVPGSFQFSESGNAAVFYPASDYFENTKYKVELTTGVQGVDPANGAVYSLAAGDPKRRFSFTTGTTTDDVPPKVDLTEVTPFPTDGATNMCLNPTLQVSFSESLDPASPKDSNFWLYPAAATPSDALDVANILVTSIGGEPDDTIVTKPDAQLNPFSDYSISLYSGDASTDAFEGAIYDTCGNPLSGDFDDDMEGSPVDDFVDPKSSGESQAFCRCLSGTDTCNVAVGSTSCQIADGTTCNLSSACASTSDSYIGFNYQWTWKTGDQPLCVPNIKDITQEDTYYSEDKDPVDHTGAEDTGVTLITGDYLYPFYDVDFFSNVSAAGMNCFDTSFRSRMACFITNLGTQGITVRTPVASTTGRISVENGAGSDTSSEAAIIDSPFIRSNSPVEGPVGQFITIRGRNFIDYDPAVPGSTPGRVLFGGQDALIMCADGWDDDHIIVRVPDNLQPGDAPLVQVITVGADGVVNTADDKYSNQEAFTITDGEPGPGICELVPNCSDTGLDDVTVIGENFGDNGAVYFTPSDNDPEFIRGEVKSWNVSSEEFNSQVVITNKTPVTERDTYAFTAGNIDNISNSLDFKITCSEPPALFNFYMCDLNQDTLYLPNPQPYTDNACVNNVVYFAFTNVMNNDSVTQNAKVFRCNTGDIYDDATCTTPVAGHFVVDYLAGSYRGRSAAEQLDGTSDVDGNGQVNVADGNSAYTFYPNTALDPNYNYKVVIPNTVTNTIGVQLEQSYDWHFKVRNDARNCVADYLALNPATQLVSRIDTGNACLDNYIFDEDSYSFRARVATSDCLMLNDAGNYTWSIDQAANDDVLTFGENQTTGDIVPLAPVKLTDTSTNGYNTACVQGKQQNNDGTATVTANLLDPETGLPGVSDTATVQVDFGFCTQDSDCFTQSCRDTFCDQTTHHCAPDITSFSPNNEGTPDVGPGGCLTLNGCYFGTDEQQNNSCTCTSLEKPGETCSVQEGSTRCLLSDSITTCSVGESLCDLGATCNPNSPEANYENGFFGGCTCNKTVGNEAKTCRVAEGETSCVVEGNSQNVCGPSTPGFTQGATGSVTFNSTTAATPNPAICGDIWNENQVVVQVPDDGSVPAGDYDVTLKSYYQLSDTIEDCTVGSEETACLCQINPDEAEEGDLTQLSGENFDILANDGNKDVTFLGDRTRLSTEGLETWLDANTIEDAPVPAGAVGSETEGVQLESTRLKSNALAFGVSCQSDFDCSTGCCSTGQCMPAEACNTCQDDLDCNNGVCSSTCDNGVCKPVVTELSPSQGAVGQPVTIQGCFFGSYYDPSIYAPGSTATADGITMPLACGVIDSWNNRQIIATMPDGIFSDANDTNAMVKVTQVSTRDGAQVARDSNEVEFKRDDSCSMVDLPVLCRANPAYSAPQTLTDRVENIKLRGKNFANQAGGYCTCNLATLGTCRMNMSSASCAKSQTTTYYVNPNFTSERCADGTNGQATTNGYTTFDPAKGRCVYQDPANERATCEIAVGETHCDITVNESCDLGGATCSAAVQGFVSLSGAAVYNSNKLANVDWTQFIDTQYITDVPVEAETGDVRTIATTNNNVQCTSNGLEFPITCSSCGDCSAGLNCNLAADDAFGMCTSQNTGFCRTAPTSCCGQTSCVFDSAGTTDPGSCEPQPLLSLDHEETELVNGETVTTQVTTLTHPGPGTVNSCPNAMVTMEFNMPVTTAEAFPFNDNDPTGVEDEDLLADDIPLELIKYQDYIQVRKASEPDTAFTSLVASITPAADGKVLTLTLNQLLEFNTEYEVIIRSNKNIVPGGRSQTGIVSAEYGTALGCDATMLAADVCEDGYVRYTFKTVPQSEYQQACAPAYVELKGANQKFVDANYTFSRSGQTERILSTVFAAGKDHVVHTDDDQPIVRIDDGDAPGFSWQYDWDPLYEKIEDLEAAQCPVAGVVTGGAATGFVEDVPSQVLTSDTPPDTIAHTDTVDVVVRGDGSVAQGWGNPTSTADDLSASLLFDLHYCEPDQLVTYNNLPYHFYWSYCRTDGKSAALPKFVEAFHRDAAQIDNDYGTDQEFIYEVAFKTDDSQGNDPAANNNLIAVRVYPNDFDGNLSTVADSVDPNLWFLLNAANAGGEGRPTTVDGYQALQVGNTTYVAATNLVEGGLPSVVPTGTLSPYVFVVAFSNDADETTRKAVNELINGFRFNRNTELSRDCALKKADVVVDTKRVNDLGTISYLLSSYYYGDTDGNNVDDFPSLANATYVPGITNSVWPSWDTVLGNLLGQSLGKDPVNAFADAANNCPYNPPDVSAGETSGTYYDEAGTCWDPVLKDFKGPVGSNLYLYQYRDPFNFALYANLKYTGVGSWRQGSYDPCRKYDDGVNVTADISNFSDLGCSTFNYVVDDSKTTKNSTYDNLFSQ